MGNPHYRNARQRQRDEYDLEHRRHAVLSNFRRGLIAANVAARQLAEAGLFEAEIREALA